MRPADADLGGAGVRAGAGNDYAGGEDVSVRSVPVLRGAGESVKTRLLLLDGEDRALVWTNRNPKHPGKAGVMMFRHSTEVVTGDFARRVIAAGGRIESTHPERVRAALGCGADDRLVGLRE